jgi:hypothetical protein
MASSSSRDIASVVIPSIIGKSPVLSPSFFREVWSSSWFDQRNFQLLFMRESVVRADHFLKSMECKGDTVPNSVYSNSRDLRYSSPVMEDWWVCCTMLQSLITS